MHILLVSPMNQGVGGIARWSKHVMFYYDSLSKKPCKLELFDMSRSHYIPDDIAFWPRLTSALRDYKKLLEGLKQQLDIQKYDLIHVTSSASLGLLKDLIILYYAKRKKIRTVVHFRFGRIPELFLKKNWEWKLLCCVVNKADRVIVIDKSSFETLNNIGYKNISLLPNPIAPRVMEYINENQGVLRVHRTILFVGHCIRPKGVYELIEVCKSLTNIKVKLVGTIQDEVRKDLKELAHNGEWLDLMGERSYEEVLHEMLACDVFALPTYTEGFPNVILEAMACGCAIVTTPVGAIPEMLNEENGKHFGLLVETKNVQQLHDGLMRMLEDEDFKSECRTNVKQRVYEWYSMPKIWNQLVDLWQNL